MGKTGGNIAISKNEHPVFGGKKWMQQIHWRQAYIGGSNRQNRFVSMGRGPNIVSECPQRVGNRDSLKGWWGNRGGDLRHVYSSLQGIFQLLSPHIHRAGICHF